MDNPSISDETVHEGCDKIIENSPWYGEFDAIGSHVLGVKTVYWDTNGNMLTVHLVTGRIDYEPKLPLEELLHPMKVLEVPEPQLSPRSLGDIRKLAKEIVDGALLRIEQNRISEKPTPQDPPCPHGHEDWSDCPVCGH